MIHIWRPWKLSNFQDHPPPLSIYIQNSSTPLTWDVQFQKKSSPLLPPPSPPPPRLSLNDNQSIKKNIIQGWLLHVIRSFLQVGFRFQCQHINLVWLSFDFFSFSWSLTIISPSSWLYILVCTVVRKYQGMSFVYNYSHF